MIKNAKKKIKASKNLKLSIGDSFGQHGWGTDSNLLDNIFKCDSKENCTYLNLSSFGSDPENYFNSIKQTLGDRIYSPYKKEKILISIYYGNDIVKYGADELEIKNKKSCLPEINEISNNSTINYKVTINNFLNRYLKSINIYRQAYRRLRYKYNMVEKYKATYIATAYRLRRCLIPNEKNTLEKIKNNLNNIDENYFKDVVTYKYSYSDLIIAIAYPEYYLDLYSLDKYWSRMGLNRLKKEINNFNQFMTKKFPNSEITYIGIPDKFIWRNKIDKRILENYNLIGASLNEMVEKDGHVKSKFFNFTNSINNFFVENNIRYIYLPSLLKKEDDVFSLFYNLDVHLNSYGNKLLSEYINKKNLLK